MLILNGEKNIYHLMRERDVHSRLREEGMSYRVFGGIAAHAILNASTINWGDRIIEIDPESSLSTVRENGTQRDIDTLVVSTETNATRTAHEALKKAVGEYLMVSVTGLKRETEARKSLLPNMDIASRRTVDDEGKYHVQLDTVETELPQSWYEEWEVHTPDDESPLFATLSPVVIESLYRMSSITGVRLKDEEKLRQLQAKVCMDGGNPLNIRLIDDLIAHYNAQKEAGLAHARSIEGKRNDAHTWFGRKAIVLGYIERHPWLARRTQGRLESVLGYLASRSF